MSAGPSPPNPGQSRARPGTLGPGFLARRGPLILASVAVGATTLFYATRKPPQPEGTPSTFSGTPGVHNIEGAYTNAGATSTHTKAYGGTPMGDKDDEQLRRGSPAGTNAPKGFKDKPTGDEQRASVSTSVEKKLQKMNYGSESGK